jgi:dihydroorotase
MVTEGGIKQSDILIEDGIIKAIDSAKDRPSNPSTSLKTDHQTIDATGLLIFPGLIDCHVHFREPGYEEAEDMTSGALSAQSGGVTTVCEMPNTNPPTCTRSALKEKLHLAAGIGNRESGIDIHLFFNVSTEEHLKELKQIDTNNMDSTDSPQICGVKLYFDHSTGDLGADKKAIEGAFKLCAQKNIPVVCHCEDAAINAEARKRIRQDVIEAHSLNRPVASEAKAIQRAIGLSETYGTALHIAHLSTSAGLGLVRKAKKDQLNVTCEVTPHHLFLSVNDYDTLGTLAKMNPPLRTKDHCEALMQGVIDGSIDCIATDHAPHTLQTKGYAERNPSVTLSEEAQPRITDRGSPLDAPSGVPGVETMLPLLLTLAAHTWPHPKAKKSSIPVFQYSNILRLCFTLPNRIFSLGKAGITVGKPTDLILVNPKKTWTIHGKDLHSKCGWTPYEGWEVTGKVVHVIR